MTPAPYDLILGLDRSDQKADLCLLDTHTGTRRSVVIDTAPEALCEWLAELRQQHPTARVGLCLEQPAVHLIPFLEAYAWITLHPINPLCKPPLHESQLETWDAQLVTFRCRENGGTQQRCTVTGPEFVRRV